MLTAMRRTPACLVLGAVLALLAWGTVGFTHASRVAANDLTNAALPTSAAPGLLGPIDALGRNGWRCLPERAAATSVARDAELPQGDRP